MPIAAKALIVLCNPQTHEMKYETVLFLLTDDACHPPKFYEQASEDGT